MPTGNKLDNETVIRLASELGFTLTGFALYQKLGKETSLLMEWLGKGYHAGMEYMAKNTDKREDPALILPSVKSVISLALNYKPAVGFPPDEDKLKVSSYAWGEDYHYIMWDKLSLLVEKFRETEPDTEAVYYVDTGPVMDKVWAVKAGLGWMGKHSNIINREIGSWFFIANIFINKEFTPSPEVEDFCGTCTACIDACPTEAIVPGRMIDSGRCISYLTIENKSDIIPDEFRGKFENWVFGCDICQDVCPWNIRFSVPATEPRFEQFTDSEGNPMPKNVTLTSAHFEGMSEREFRKKFDRSPLKRAKLKGIKRNIQFVTGQKI